MVRGDRVHSLLLTIFLLLPLSERVEEVLEWRMRTVPVALSVILLQLDILVVSWLQYIFLILKIYRSTAELCVISLFVTLLLLEFAFSLLLSYFSRAWFELSSFHLSWRSYKWVYLDEHYFILFFLHLKRRLTVFFLLPLLFHLLLLNFTFGWFPSFLHEV